MQKILKTNPASLSKFVKLSKAEFGTNTLTHQLNPYRNHQLRVMSTPEWPVPYYQRAFRDLPKYSMKAFIFHIIIS